MASSIKRLSASFKSNNDTGFGSNASSYGGRFINKDGSFNLRKEGISLWQRYSIYHTMLSMSRWKFALTVVVFYITLNLLFTCIYLLIGTQQFQGIIAATDWDKIKELYFFSTQTFTTVGYGRVNPVGDWANIISSFEAMMGFLSFAVVTGLIYGRFSKPRPHLIFSHHALIAPYQNKTGLMFRVVPYKDSHTLTDVNVQVTAGMQIEEDGKMIAKFYSLALERNRVDSLMMNWTIVHPVDEESPLFGLSADDMKTADLEIYVLLRGFDEVYSNTVLQRTSYTYDEIMHNTKFIPMYHESEDGKTTILELDKIHAYEQL